MPSPKIMQFNRNTFIIPNKKNALSRNLFPNVLLPSLLVLVMVTHVGHVLRSLIGQVFRSAIFPRGKSNFHFNSAMTQGIIQGCCTRFSLHHRFFLPCRIVPYVACVFHQHWNCTWVPLVRDSLKTSESGNPSVCVQGAQDHCSLTAEALKIWPSNYCQHESLRISRRNISRGAPLSFSCKWSNTRKALFLCTVLYLLCDIRLCCILAIYKITLCRVCAYSWWASKTELALKYWAICHKILENAYTPSDAKCSMES